MATKWYVNLPAKVDDEKKRGLLERTTQPSPIFTCSFCNASFAVASDGPLFLHVALQGVVSDALRIA